MLYLLVRKSWNNVDGMLKMKMIQYSSVQNYNLKNFGWLFYTYNVEITT
jgi:hypothetical protein